MGLSSSSCTNQTEDLDEILTGRSLILTFARRQRERERERDGQTERVCVLC